MLCRGNTTVALTSSNPTQWINKQIRAATVVLESSMRETRHHLVKPFKSFVIYISQADVISQVSKPRHDLSSYPIVSTRFDTEKN